LKLNFIVSNEEDVMDMLSVSDNFDMTREEECDLLGDDEMAVDSPVKKSTNESTTDRKPIVFDLRESLEEDDENDGEERDKFKTERQTINLKASQKWKGLGVPERLDSIKIDKKQRKRLNGKRNRRNRRGFGFGGDGQQNGRQSNRQSNHPFKRSGDLRQFINQQKSGSNGSQFINYQTLPSIGIGMTPLMNYVMILILLK
jgi:hypothetical protein